eukprot:881020-Pelagomonas_calceolata.AAC.4
MPPSLACCRPASLTTLARRLHNTCSIIPPPSTCSKEGYEVVLINSNPAQLVTCLLDTCWLTQLACGLHPGHQGIHVAQTPFPLCVPLCNAQATIMTDPGLAHRTFIGPMTVEYAEQVIAKYPQSLLPCAKVHLKEVGLPMRVHRSDLMQSCPPWEARLRSIWPRGSRRCVHSPSTRDECVMVVAIVPDGCGSGGPCAHACSSHEAWAGGILEKYGVELIGAKLPSIDRAEDRELFKLAMGRIGLSSDVLSVCDVREDQRVGGPEAGLFEHREDKRVGAGDDTSRTCISGLLLSHSRLVC